MTTDSKTRVQLGGSLCIPQQELEFTAVRAQGPGGQHVNKSSTAVHLRFNIASSSVFDEEQRARLLAIRDRRISSDGIVVIKAQRFRSQEKNRQDALDRLGMFLEKGLSTTKPRKPTRPGKAAKKKRTDDKTRRGRLKALRRSRTDD